MTLYWHELVSGRRKGLIPEILKGALGVASGIYGAGVFIRNEGFDRGWRRLEKLSCPVISVGNLTVGGSGKTPLVIALVRMISGWGKKTAVLSRGYGRSSRGLCVVSDGSRVIANSTDSGDEPYQLASALPRTAVVVSADRAAAGREAIRLFSPDVILLDDGFQHRSLNRDLDLVCVDVSVPFESHRLLPRGILREGWTSLRRAQAVVLTRCDQAGAEVVSRWKALLKKHNPGLALFESEHRPAGFFRLDGAAATSEEREAAAFSSIGNPEAFERTLRSTGWMVRETLRFPDHHAYGPEDWKKLEALRAKGRTLVTTEKDSVRLGALRGTELSQNILILKTELVIRENQDLWQNIIRQVCTRNTSSSAPSRAVSAS